MMAKRSKSSATGTYPGTFYHAVRLLQTLSALTVAGIMFFFIAHLNAEHFLVPWMFYFVRVASCSVCLVGSRINAGL